MTVCDNLIYQRGVLIGSITSYHNYGAEERRSLENSLSKTDSIIASICKKNN